MRSIHILPGLSEASGPSYSVVRLCEKLLEHKEDVVLATLDWASNVNLPAFATAFPIECGPKRLGRSLEMYRWLSERCADGDIDILHNHGMWQMNSVYPVWLAKRGNVQLIWSTRGALSKRAMQNGSRVKKLFWPFLQYPALKQTACFHATSDDEYADIRRIGFNQPVAVIPNGVDIVEYSKKDVPQGQRTVLFLSRIHKIKGLEILLRAWQEIEANFDNWRLIIVGSDIGYYGCSGYLQELKLLSAKLNLSAVEFYGAAYGEQKLKLYQEADLFVLPTLSENFGMVVAEALSSGTPAIVSKGAPWSGLIQNGAGWWIDIGIDPLVACLKEALSLQPEELAAMGMRGRQWMERDFSWSAISKKMIETYRWLFDRSQPVPTWVRLD